MDFLFLNNERRRLLEDEDCRKNSRVNKKKKIVTSREIKKLDFIFTKKMNVRKLVLWPTRPRQEGGCNILRNYFFIYK